MPLRPEPDEPKLPPEGPSSKRHTKAGLFSLPRPTPAQEERLREIKTSMEKPVDPHLAIGGRVAPINMWPVRCARCEKQIGSTNGNAGIEAAIYCEGCETKVLKEADEMMAKLDSLAGGAP